ncbi:hypothetical protein NE619_15420 [Anaerovorax odorimutans]|uniref:Uncharacterized protein n=1 Tax=Anaerovorax odorimutans TaxID=109327 RepID=A0ABT1RTD5_9FIRM|nr:hypothetical protein [Anaerovorax odorimutans]MCQ4638126.1 hypothetical protein [Anaerovorax odorimutans]
MTDNELLLSISELLDKKLKPLDDRTKQVELLLEQDIIPRLQNIESCYTSTYRRYAVSSEELDALKADMEIIKNVIAEHSKKLKEIS